MTDVSAMSTEDLCAEFCAGLRVTVEYLKRLAVVLAELDRRGVIINDVNPHLLRLLREVASGALLAEAVVRFGATPRALAAVRRMPPEEQAATLADEDRVRQILRPKAGGLTRNGVLNEKPKAGKGGSGSDLRNEVESRHPLLIAERATPNDLAEMIAGMIDRNPDPAAVWSRLCGFPLVRRLMGQRPAV